MSIIIPNKVTPLVLSYPDFVLGAIINPDEFDQNNLDMQDKLNSFVDTINTLIDNDDESIDIVAAINQSITTLSNNTTISLNNLTTSINAVNTALNTHKTSTDHDTRYYTKTTSDNRFVLKTEIDTRVGVTYYSEVFNIVNADNGDGTFTYTDADSNVIVGVRDSTYQYFVLQKGDYTLGENRISAIVNDTLHRSSVSGGLIENTSTSVGIISELSGAEVTINYFSVSGSLGSGIVVGTNTPTNVYYGKLWIDTSGG